MTAAWAWAASRARSRRRAHRAATWGAAAARSCRPPPPQPTLCRGAEFQQVRRPRRRAAPPQPASPPSAAPMARCGAARFAAGHPAHNRHEACRCHNRAGWWPPTQTLRAAAHRGGGRAASI
eukprot:5678465-Prymnesium_polylepis.1